MELPRYHNTHSQPYQTINEDDIVDESFSSSSHQDSITKKEYIRNLQRTALYFLLPLGLFFLGIAAWYNAHLVSLKQSVILKVTPYRVATHPELPTSYWGIVTKPYPTGAFWTNLVVKSGDGAVAVYPYGVKTLDAGIQVSYGAFRRQVSATAIIDVFALDVQISSVQSYMSRAVEAYDNVSVTMGYKTINNGKYRVFLVKGSPYTTTYFENTTPVITSPVMKITAVDARVVKDSVGTQYIVTLGNYQKWFVYCSEAVIFTWKENSLTAATPIKGIVRMAILPVQNIEAAFAVYLQYAGKYATGGNLSFAYPTATSGVMTISYTSIGTGPLLMLALPHHLPLLTPAVVTSAESVKAQMALSPLWCTKGKLKAIVTGDSTWKLTYTYPTSISWNYNVQEKLSMSQLDEVAKYLLQEVKPPYTNVQQQTSTINDIYSFGKQLGRMARLAILADNLGISEVRQQAIYTLETSIIPWLQAMNTDPLVFDHTYGGLMTQSSISDMNANYGSGWYADHHFHYGYFLNAFAVLAKMDMPFYEANKAGLDTFVRDIVNPDPTDPDFPYVRHKDFFDGHSWASGLFQQANGKGQESSSEAANAYYGAYLYAGAINNLEFQKFAQLLLFMEIQATQTYWHMTTDDDIYDNIFATSKMVGNIGAMDATVSTWFGGDLEFVHGINMMPLTPVTAILFDTNYVLQQYPVLANKVPLLPPPSPKTTPISVMCNDNPTCKAAGLQGQCCPTPEGAFLACCPSPTNSGQDRSTEEWRSYVYIDLAIVDKETAWTQLQAMSGFGNGNSRANSLFWAASRSPPVPGFNSSVKAKDIPSSSPLVKSSCLANSACDAIGIIGECCPTPEGIMLGCCPRV